MSGWDDLLVVLAETPRENGTAALHRAAEFLRGVLEAAGLDVTLEPIAAAPYRLRLAGVVVAVILLWWIDLSWLSFFLLAGLLAAYELALARVAEGAEPEEAPPPDDAAVAGEHHAS